MTADIDVVLVLRLPDIPALQSAFPEAEYYVPPAETMREAIARTACGMFNLIHHQSQFKADLYLVSRSAACLGTTDQTCRERPSRPN